MSKNQGQFQGSQTRTQIDGNRDRKDKQGDHFRRFDIQPVGVPEGENEQKMEGRVFFP